MSLTFYKPPQDGPQLNEWVWVTDYIDFTQGQRELCRVCKGDFPNQLVLKGHWRGGQWAYTQVEIGLYPPDQPGRRKADYEIVRESNEPNTSLPVWRARYIRS